MNWYTLYCVNLDAMEIVAQQWREKRNRRTRKLAAALAICWND